MEETESLQEDGLEPTGSLGACMQTRVGSASMSRSADGYILLVPYTYPLPSGLYQGLQGQNTGSKRVTLSRLSLWSGMFLSVASQDKVSIMLSSGAGLEVSVQGPFLSVSILLPEKFQTHTRGLLGTLNDNSTDDFTLRNGQVLPLNASARQVFQFGADCE